MTQDDFSEGIHIIDCFQLLIAHHNIDSFSLAAVYFRRLLGPLMELVAVPAKFHFELSGGKSLEPLILHSY